MKRSFFQPIILTLLITISLFANILAQDKWLELQTKNFKVVGNVSETELNTVANRLENFHHFFGQNFLNADIETPFQTDVIVFKDESGLKIDRPSFVTADSANYAVLSLKKPETFQTFQSGYARFLLENNIGRNLLPAWLFEGLAEYFQASQVEKNIKILRQNQLIPVEVLLETDHFSLSSQPLERKQIFRAESWALLRFLLKNETGLEQVEKFIELKRLGIENRNALAQVFQTNAAKIKEEFPKFLETNNFETKPAENLWVETGWQTTQISESKWLAVQADFLFYANRWRDAENLVEKSLKLEPNQTLALTVLALIKAHGFYYDKAEKLAEKAIEIEPDNFQNYFRYALVMSKRGMTEYGFVSGYNASLANQMRESLERAIELNPSFTESYALLAFVNFIRNEFLDESIGLIQKALKAASGSHKYQIRLAELNLRKEKFGEARRLVLQVLQNTENAGVKLYAQNTIQRIDATEYQLERIRREKAKYVNDDIVTDRPLSEEEIRKLREKATNDQIRAILRRPNVDEKRVFGTLTKIECGKNKVNFLVKTPTGFQRFHSNSLDGIILLSLVEEMSDYRLNCGNPVRENNAAIIVKDAGELVSIEFVPRGFK